MKIDEFHIHEAIDRTYCVIEMVHLLLVGHPAIREGGFEDKVHSIIDNLCTLYQDIGTKHEHFDFKEDKE